MQRSSIVTGGSSQIGTWLLPRLVDRGETIAALSRGMKARAELGPSVRWHVFDFAGPDRPLPEIAAETLYHTTHIWLLPDWIDRCADVGVRRIIAFSSTSRLTKAESASAHDRELSQALKRAEDVSAKRCARHGIALTVLRPTITYGGKLEDRSIGDIARLIDLFGFFPIVGGGRGLRQPVHADDLAAAAVAAADAKALPETAYNLGGGELLTYAQMVARIFEAMGRRPKLLPIPMPLFRAAIRAARFVPRYGHLTTGIGERMNQDLVFDVSIADRAFGYSPRPFQPDATLYGLCGRH